MDNKTISPTGLSNGTVNVSPSVLLMRNLLHTARQEFEMLPEPTPEKHVHMLAEGLIRLAKSNAYPLEAGPTRASHRLRKE